MTVGFAEGLKATNPDAKLIYSVIGEAAYDDAAGAKRVTEQQLAADADIIFGMGDGASFGMLASDREHNAEANAIPRPGSSTSSATSRADYSDVAAQPRCSSTTPAFTSRSSPMSARPTSARSTPWMSRMVAFACSTCRQQRSAGCQGRGRCGQGRILDGPIKVDAIGDAEAMKAKLSELFPQ